MITAVPLHWFKYLMRGFNQSEIIAKSLAKNLAIPYQAGLLIKKRYTTSQTKYGRKQRLANIAGSLTFNHRFTQMITGKKILLVDDVVTTNATITKCSELLLAKGAREVAVATLAVTPLGGKDST